MAAAGTNRNRPNHPHQLYVSTVLPVYLTIFVSQVEEIQVPILVLI